MTHTIKSAFETFDANLNLDPEERAAAEKLHNEITDVLKAKRIAVGAFLQGSFRRKTMLPPLHDVDKVILLHSSMKHLTPDQVMDAIEIALAEAYPDATFPKPRSRHALKMELAGCEFHFDSVPAWDTTGDDPDREVLIADRDHSTWKASNTRKLISVIQVRNGDTGGRFIHWVRMAKAAVTKAAGDDIPGLHVETWAYHSVAESLADDVALAQILATGAELLGTTYYDPTGVDQISDRLGPDALRHQAALKAVAEQAREALELAAAGDDNEAIRIWHDIFGDEFPKATAVDAATAVGAAFHAGSVTSTGHITTAKTGQTLTPTRSWGPR